MYVCVCVCVDGGCSCLSVCLLVFLQVMSHTEAAQLAAVVIVCVHREHYDFMEEVAPQLKGKVLPLTIYYTSLMTIHTVHLRHVFWNAAICTSDLAKYGRPHRSSECKRETEILSILGSDPYLLPPVFFSPLVSASSLPQINFHDIYIYLVHNPSPYSGDILKAFKSTDAYQYAVAGWVKDAKVRHLATNNLNLIMAKLSTIYL